MDIKKDETRSFDFTMPLQTSSPSVQLFGGTLQFTSSAVPSSASVFSPTKYEVIAVADLDGVAIDPTDMSRISLI